MLMEKIETTDIIKQKDIYSRNLLKAKYSAVKYSFRIFGVSQKCMIQKQKRLLKQIHDKTKFSGMFWIYECGILNNTNPKETIEKCRFGFVMIHRSLTCL